MKSAKIDTSEMKDLIKGERSAVETYRQVFEKYGKDSKIDRLRHFSADHKRAVRELMNDASMHDVDVPESSGAWGSWAKLVTGTAKTMGEEMALRALKEGEEHGLKLYEDALKKEKLPESTKTRIEQEFIPLQQQHIREIDSLMKAV